MKLIKQECRRVAATAAAVYASSLETQLMVLATEMAKSGRPFDVISTQLRTMAV